MAAKKYLILHDFCIIILDLASIQENQLQLFTAFDSRPVSNDFYTELHKIWWVLPLSEQFSFVRD